MSHQGLEVIDITVQKTHEWVGAVADATHLDKADGFRALRAVLQTLRDRLPVETSAHFAAQLPMLLRGLFYEGWEPARVPVKMNREEFAATVGSRIVTDHFIDPNRITRDVFAVMSYFIGWGELAKVRQSLPEDVRQLWLEPSILAV